MAKIAAGGAGLFLLAVLLVPVLRDDGYSALRDSISEGALGPRGWLQTAAFVVLALASAALVLLVRDATSGRRRTAMTVLLSVWAAGVLVSALVPVDPGAEGATTGGKVHLAAALLAFVAVLAAMWVAVSALGRAPGWQGSRPWLLGLATATTVLLVVMGAAPQDSSWGGLAQRAFVTAVVAWIVAWIVAVSVQAARGRSA